jgi:hypothetical protein
VLAVTKATGYAKGSALAVHDDHGVYAVRFAGATEVLERLTGPIRPEWWHDVQ